MERHLSPTWKLSTDHAASSLGIPVLVSCASGAAYGPGDIVKLYPSYGLGVASDQVRRLARTKQLDNEGEALVEKFLQKGGSLEQNQTKS